MYSMILGITGGIGCGKTTAASLFEKRGFSRIDSDLLIRNTVLASSEVLNEIRAHLGTRVFDSQGALNRSALAAIVFTQEAELKWLENLTHPRLFDLWRGQLATNPEGKWVIEAPLLFEANLQNWFDFTVCVACSSDLQRIRLEQRGLNRGLAEQRISQQLPLSRKVEWADFVLWNSSSTAFLEAQIDRLVANL